MHVCTCVDMHHSRHFEWQVGTPNAWDLSMRGNGSQRYTYWINDPLLIAVRLHKHSHTCTHTHAHTGFHTGFFERGGGGGGGNSWLT